MIASTDNVTDMAARRRENSGWEWSEDGLAVQFRQKYPDYRWVELWHRWFRWAGTVWERDNKLDMFTAVRKFIRDLSVFQEQEGKAAKLNSKSTVAAVEWFCHRDEYYAAEPDEFDVDPWRLNTPEGVVDLKSGAMDTHNPLDYMTKITAAGPAGECPRWMQFLHEVTDGDRELVEFLQRMVGYCLTGSTREHAMFFLYGTGRNGKGTFLNTLTGLLGDYATVASMETFTEQRGERHPTDLAMLQGARLVVAQETQEGRRWAETKIKALTGGDPVTARFMRQDYFTYTPQFKLVIAGNFKPRLSSVDEAMRRRLNLIPFTVRIPKADVDPDLSLALENEWSGVCAWAVTGCLDYLARGLNPPAVVREATDAYFQTQDTFTTWINICCKTGPDEYDPPKRMFGAWRKYAEEGKEYVGSQSQFVDRMEAAGFSQHNDRRHNGRYWKGISLKLEYRESGL